jgi:hypothetical protein
MTAKKAEPKAEEKVEETQPEAPKKTAPKKAAPTKDPRPAVAAALHAIIGERIRAFMAKGAPDAFGNHYIKRSYADDIARYVGAPFTALPEAEQKELLADAETILEAISE